MTFTHKFDKIMQIKVEISQEVLAAIMNGKCVEGRLRLSESKMEQAPILPSVSKLERSSGLRKQLSSLGTHQVIGFTPYNRKPRGSQDKVICQLENGWLKESPRRIKFYNSVKKELGCRMVDVVMHRDLKSAMEVMEIQEILDNI